MYPICQHKGQSIRFLLWVFWSKLAMLLYISAQRSCWGGILVSVRPSVRLSVRPSRIPCPLCNAYSSGWIHFIYTRLIKQLQKVCRMYSFLQNLKIWIFGNFLKFVTLTLSCFHLDLMWISSVGNHGAAGGISERRCSSYYSSLL